MMADKSSAYRNNIASNAAEEGGGAPAAAPRASPYISCVTLFGRGAVGARAGTAASVHLQEVGGYIVVVVIHLR